MDHDSTLHGCHHTFRPEPANIRRSVRTDIPVRACAADSRDIPGYRSKGIAFLVRFRLRPVPACRDIEDIHVPAACDRDEPAGLQDRKDQRLHYHGIDHPRTDDDHSPAKRDRIGSRICGIHIHALQGRPHGMAHLPGRNGHSVLHPDPDSLALCRDTRTGRSSFTMHNALLGKVQVVAHDRGSAYHPVRLHTFASRPVDCESAGRGRSRSSGSG